MGIQSTLNQYEDVAGGVTNGLYRVSPWHGTGESKDAKGNVVGIKRQLTTDPRTVEEIAPLAGIDWTVAGRTLDQLGVTLGNAEKVKLLVRDDTSTILGVHSEGYGLLQNRECLAFVEEILRVRSDAKLRSVTELFGGEVIFSMVEFQDGVAVTRRDGTKLDKHTPFMGIYWSHNGRYPLAVKYARHEWVCRNTFTPWNAQTGLVVRHTRNASDLAGVALQAIEGMMRATDAFDVEVERLLNQTADEATLKRAVIPAVIGYRPKDEGRAQTFYDNAFAGIVAEWNGYTPQETAFDCVMAVQGYEEHGAMVRGQSRDVASIRRLMDGRYPMTAKAAGVFATN